MKVGEVAPSATGNEYLLAETRGSFEHGDAAPAFAGLQSAHQTGGAAADDDGVELVSLNQDALMIAAARQGAEGPHREGAFQAPGSHSQDKPTHGGY